MRVLIVHHGALPGPDHAGPSPGGALRALRLGEALSRAGLSVSHLSRAQDGPGGFASAAELLVLARALRPDRVICVQLEEAPALAALGVPLVVDLYAPRLVEAAFGGALPTVAADTLRALAVGDAFLASNRRQRWHWAGALALAGVDLRDAPLLDVPLACPPVRPGAPAPSALRLVAGGARWPWQDPAPGLARALAALDARGDGEIWWFGAPPVDGPLAGHPRLVLPGWRPYADLLDAYAGATAAIDWMAPNAERALALSFRHMDYLACGLPILTGPDSALTDLLDGAGLATDDVEGAIAVVADDAAARARMSARARALAAGPHHADAAAAALLAWLPDARRRPRGPSPLPEAAALAARAASAEARMSAAEDRAARAEAEVEHKRAEVGRLTGQVQDLITVTARQARALDEVAGFKREAVQVLGGRLDRAALAEEGLARENALLRADVEKKTAELRAMEELQRRLEHDLVNLRRELEEARRPRGLLRR